MTTPPVPPPPGEFPPPGNPYDGGYPPPPPGYYPYPYQAAARPTGAYTSWPTRVAAYFIDTVPIVVLIIAGQALMLATAAQSDCITEQTEQSYGMSCSTQPSMPGMLLALGLSLIALIFGIWNYGYRQGITGSSVGKSIMKFKVVGEASGQPIGFGMSLLRQLAHIVDGLICFIGYLFPLWDAKRQTLADKIMSTVCLPTD